MRNPGLDPEPWSWSFELLFRLLLLCLSVTIFSVLTMVVYKLCSRRNFRKISGDFTRDSGESSLYKIATFSKLFRGVLAFKITNTTYITRELWAKRSSAFYIFCPRIYFTLCPPWPQLLSQMVNQPTKVWTSTWPASETADQASGSDPFGFYG